MNSIVVVLLSSLCLAALLTPIVCRFAGKFGLVDAPDAERKTHGRVVPLSCGIPLLVPFTLLVLVGPLLGFIGGQIHNYSVAVLSSATVLMVVGLLDDRFALRGRQKLAGQLIAACLLVYSGHLNVSSIAVFGHKLELGIFAAPFMVFWLVGAINAFNLIDGIDGLATSVGVIISAGLGAMAMMNGRVELALLSFCVTGSLVGFLIYNFPPAKIFLGDTGSMLIGFLLGGIAIKASLKGPATAALVIPTAIWAVPIFDVSIAILRRKLTGRSLYDTDHGHLHHCLMRRSNSGIRPLAIVGFLCLLTGAGALASVAMGSDLLAVGSAITMALILVVSRSFGHTEFRMLAKQITRFGTSMLPGSKSRPKNSDLTLTRFQGTDQWDHLWSTLREFAVANELHNVELNVNLPAIGEEHHAKWVSPFPQDPARHWKTEIPLIVNGQKVGQLKVSGSVADGSFCQWIGQIVTALQPFETQLEALVGTSYSRQQADVLKLPAAAG